MSAFGWFLWLALILACLLGGAWAFKNSEQEREELAQSVQDLQVALGEALLPTVRRIDRLIRRLTRRDPDREEQA